MNKAVAAGLLASAALAANIYKWGYWENPTSAFGLYSNTLARADRKRRHLAAARFFENLDSDELAGGLAGHYLAAQQNAAEAREADALAAALGLPLRPGDPAPPKAG